MTVSLSVNFNNGDGWLDFSSLVRACPRSERACSEDFTHAVSQCDLTLKHDTTFLGKLAVARGDVDVVIQLDGQPYFAGRIPPSVQFESLGANVSGDPDVADLEIEVLDYSSKLDREITEDDDVAWENQAVCDPGATGASIAHRLLALCDLTGPALDITVTISTVLVAFAVSSGTVAQVLDKLLMEYGFTYRFDRAGKLVLFQTIIETPISTVDLDEQLVMSGLRPERIEREFDGAELSWYSFHAKEQALVYLADLPIGSNNRYSGYPIQPTFLWPAEANVEETWMDYQDNGVSSKVENGSVTKNRDFSQIVLTKNHTVDESFQAGITRETTVYKNRRARMAYRNGAGTAKLLYWCGIYADVIYLGAENKVRKDSLAGAKRIDKYQAAFIHDVDTASRLACARAGRFYKAAWRFTFQSQTELPPGTIGSLADPYSGFPFAGLEPTVMVLECRTDPETGTYSLKAISIAAVDVDPTWTKSTLIPNVPQTKDETTQGQIQNVPTFEDLDVGYTSPSGGTTIATAPTLSAQGFFKGIVLRVDRQLTLTNFSQYEFQVTDDADALVDQDTVTWYSLRFDYVDWKGALDAVTPDHAEMLVHTTPLDFTDPNAPIGYTLYYRARRKTTAPGGEGPWSATATATAKPIEDGDIPINTIIANLILAGFLQTAYAEVTGELIIGSSYDLGVDPAEGDQKIVLHDNMIALMEYTLGSWRTVTQIGGTDNLKSFIQAKGIIKTGALTELNAIPQGDVMPAGVKLHGFENVYTENLGVDPWDAKNFLSFSGTPRFGSYSLANSAAGKIGRILDNAALGLAAADGGLAFYHKKSAITRTRPIAAVGKTTHTFSQFNIPNNYGNWRCIWIEEQQQFVAVSSGVGGTTTGQVLTSPDGQTWTQRVSASLRAWRCLAYSPKLDMIVAVAEDGGSTTGQIMTSTDGGVSWIGQNGVGPSRSIIWVDDLLGGAFFYSTVDSSNHVGYSTDGVNWGTYTITGAVNNWTCIIWLKQRATMVVVSNSDVAANQVANSPDGQTWTRRTASQARQWMSMAYSPELDILVATAMDGAVPTGQVMTSADGGATWTNRASAALRAWPCVTWISELAMFYACSSTAGTLASMFMSSTDGITWTARTSPVDNKAFQQVSWSQRYGLIAMGSNVTTASMFLMADFLGFRLYETPTGYSLRMNAGAVVQDRPAADDAWHHVGFTQRTVTAQPKWGMAVDDWTTEVNIAALPVAASSVAMLFLYDGGMIDELIYHPTSVAGLSLAKMAAHYVSALGWVNGGTGAVDYLLDLLLLARAGGRVKIAGAVALTSLVAYANNAAAVAAGLIIGDLYRIGDTVAIVHA